VTREENYPRTTLTVRVALGPMATSMPDGEHEYRREHCIERPKPQEREMGSNKVCLECTNITGWNAVLSRRRVSGVRSQTNGPCLTV